MQPVRTSNLSIATVRYYGASCCGLASFGGHSMRLVASYGTVQACNVSRKPECATFIMKLFYLYTLSWTAASSTGESRHRRCHAV